MQTRIYQIYTSSSQANAASATIIARGVITGVKWVTTLDSVTDNASLDAELSFSSTSQVATNGGQGVIDAVKTYNNVLTSGISMEGINQQTIGLQIPVQPGNILYLNTSFSGGGSIKCLVQVME